MLGLDRFASHHLYPLVHQAKSLRAIAAKTLMISSLGQVLTSLNALLHDCDRLMQQNGGANIYSNDRCILSLLSMNIFFIGNDIIDICQNRRMEYIQEKLLESLCNDSRSSLNDITGLFSNQIIGAFENNPNDMFDQPIMDAMSIDSNSLPHLLYDDQSSEMSFYSSPGSLGSKVATNRQQNSLEVINSTIGSPTSNPRRDRTGKRSNYPDPVNLRLFIWLVENKENPYPNETKKEQFCNELGLNMVQLNNWNPQPPDSKSDALTIAPHDLLEISLVPHTGT
ncbi:hypothetical protein HDV02_006173 [Globomyces sp. JEL0801]|nr:hypothetical protein HDV02_006173 [Globomyces sp. JEL0801]